MATTTLPRGLRNNNPLNIRRNATLWRGLVAEQSDKEFFVFRSAEWGYRAAMQTLITYRKRHGLKTIGEWVARWAPPCENNTAAYIGSVCRRCGILPTDEVDVTDREALCRVVAAMSFVENGVDADMGKVYEGWNLLSNHSSNGY